MLTINIICTGKIKENYLKEGVLEYTKRLSKYCNLEIIELPDEKVPEKLSTTLEETIKQKECSNALAHIKKDSYVVCLDLKGKEISSEELSKKIDNITLSNSTITFIIGGTLGLNQEIINRANESICFSKMTFPHQLIRLFLLEQIFRAFKISKGETYHR